MRKLISFCLWGNKPKYTVGALKNIDLAKTIYPDWECHFYIANDVPTEFVEAISTRAVIHNINLPGGWRFATERFRAIDLEVDYVIFRDTDSRLSMRERDAVTDWISSRKVLHIMKDHPHHHHPPKHPFPILAGMWGLKKQGFDKNMAKLLDSYTNTEQYHYDQIFLRDFIWKDLHKSALIHDAFPSTKSFRNKDFPTPRNPNEFVGQPFDENDNYQLDQLEALSLATKININDKIRRIFRR